MASLLRQIVAGPRAKHQETGLDLCYVTENIIATSGPSQAYPQRAYRNPLDRLVAFLDAAHGERWAIWEFRAEGTGYPDEAVYGRIRHYPWPDHHPPPFRLVPMILAGMRIWLAGGPLHESEVDPGVEHENSSKAPAPIERSRSLSFARRAREAAGGGTEGRGKKKSERVVVVHCKAGKGRSGTMACCYLVAECGWRPEDALARFTERRMRPKFGAGVSIPSQLRWVSYVDRWTRGDKRYVDRPVEIVEVHVWGLRHGVKLSVEAFADEGKRISILHTFTRDERLIVEGDAPGGSGVVDLVSDMAGYGISPTHAAGHKEVEEDADYAAIANGGRGNRKPDGDGAVASQTSKTKKLKSASASGLMGRISRKSSNRKSLNKLKALGSGSGIVGVKSDSPPTVSTSSFSSPGSGAPAGVATSAAPAASSTSINHPSASSPHNYSQSSFWLGGRPATFASETEPGGMAVIFKPRNPIRAANSDVNISLERRNKTPASMGLTMVTAVAHVWFNAFFEGRGPEQGGHPDESGIFDIDWDRMDGIKGSSQKGTRAADRIAVVWRFADDVPAANGCGSGTEVDPEVPVVSAAPGDDADGHPPSSARPGDHDGVAESGQAVPQMRPADWHGLTPGGIVVDPDADRVLGLREADPASAGVSKASSIKSHEVVGADRGHGGGGSKTVDGTGDGNSEDATGGEEDSIAGVKTSGPGGEVLTDKDEKE